MRPAVAPLRDGLPGRPRSRARPSYTTTLAGPGRSAPLSGGLAASRLRPLREVSEADTIVVPGREDPLTPVSAAVLGALADAGRRGARIVSVCTGAFILADAGLLDGGRATTHWRWAAELQRLHPRVDVEERRRLAHRRAWG